MPRRSPRLHCALPAAALLLAAMPLAGQEVRVAAQHDPLPDLEQFQDEVQRQTDTVELRRWEDRFGGRAATAETEAVRRLRRGLVRIRIGEMGDGWSFQRAQKDLRAATALQPDWAYTWYALGVAERGEADWQAANRMNIGKRVGFGSLEDAVASFAEALRHDPTYRPAIQGLYDASVALRDTLRLAEIVLPALRNASAAGSRAPELYQALSRAERTIGDPESAVLAARRFLALGRDSAAGLRELAMSALVAGDPAGDSAYYAGAAIDDSAAVAAYRDDLSFIADDSTLAQFDRTHGPARTNFLRRLWTDRDRAALRADGERLREHYRRIAYAERYFGLEVNRRHYTLETDMFRSGSMRFDDRGIVYIRYGDPAERVLTVTYGIYPNETWHYARADGDLLIHFAANEGGDIHDLRLVHSVADIGGVDMGNGNNPATLFALLDRCRLYTPYCKYLNWGPNGQGKILRNERELVKNSVTWALSTDGYELHFARGLAATARAFAVGRAGDRTLVHLAFQVSLDRPDSLPEGTVFRVPLRVRASVLDRAGHAVAAVDTTTGVLLPGGGVSAAAVDAVGRVTLPVPEGHWRYQIALSWGDSAGRVLPTDSLIVGRFDGTRLAVSDLVLSREHRGALWVPVPGDSAYFNPRTTWTRQDTLSLYHEIYGLPAGAGYVEKLVLRRGKRAELSLGWEGVAGEVTRVTRTISFERVKPGDYVLEMEVTGPDGARASSRRAIRITRDEH
jgi:GWxTD domain-containing protein